MIVPALPVPLWVLTPLNIIYEKGLKSTEEEALPLNLLIRLLKQTAKERAHVLGYALSGLQP
ncbi:MAG: hypothetical protein EGQ00_01140 [Parabacteroides johnsonii]|nr:hypothetical protein [Parabacteroides johnsonii]